jgi:type VI secretion system protein ImpK
MKVATTGPALALLPLALRDTAGTVVELRSGKPPSVDVLRRQCDVQVAGLREELQRCGQPHDVIDDALYAQCALLDEVALKGLHGDARDEWEREPLQVRTFGRNDAGEELLRRIGQRLREVKPVLPLLGIFAAVLRLGFMGRFAVDGDDARAKLVSEIDERLARGAGDKPDDTSPIVVNPSRGRRRPLSPLAWVLIACIASGLVWFAIDRWLLVSIAGLTHLRT